MSSHSMLALIIVFVAQSALGIVMATFALFGDAVLLKSKAELGVGLLLGIVGLAQIVTQTSLLGPAIDRFGETRVMAIAIAVRTVSLGLFAIATMVWIAGIGSALFAISPYARYIVAFVLSGLSLIPALMLARYYGRKPQPTPA